MPKWTCSMCQTMNPLARTFCVDCGNRSQDYEDRKLVIRRADLQSYEQVDRRQGASCGVVIWRCPLHGPAGRSLLRRLGSGKLVSLLAPAISSFSDM